MITGKIIFSKKIKFKNIGVLKLSNSILKKFIFIICGIIFSPVGCLACNISSNMNGHLLYRCDTCNLFRWTRDHNGNISSEDLIALVKQKSTSVNSQITLIKNGEKLLFNVTAQNSNSKFNSGKKCFALESKCTPTKIYGVAEVQNLKGKPVFTHFDLIKKGSYERYEFSYYTNTLSKNSKIIMCSESTLNLQQIIMLVLSDFTTI